MKECKHSKLFYVLEYVLLFCFIISFALNVRLYLENDVLKELIAVELNATKDEVAQIGDDLYNANKMESNATAMEDNNATR